MVKPIILFADNDPDFLKARTEFLERGNYLRQGLKAQWP